MGAEPKKIRVEYYAHFREARRTESEEINTHSDTVREFYDELNRLHRFDVSIENTRAAVNQKIVSWDASINSGDTVVFLTPFGGG
jgi:molybdopterin converting factor small subunit